MKDVKVDPEFKALVFSLAEAEATMLEESLLAEGCRDALVTWHGLLLDGHHRLEICRKHGIEFRTVEVELEDRATAKIWILKNQFARRNLTPFQRAELALKLEPLIAEKAKEKQREGGGAVRQKSDKAVIDTKKELALIAGVSHDTIWKAREISEKASEVILERLRHGETTIAREHRALVIVERYHKLGEKKLIFPSGKYAVLLADPPWEYRNDNFPMSAAAHYPSMSIEAICEMADVVNRCVTEETVLFLWATPPLLPEALQVMAAWGFEYKTHLVWDKERAMGTGWFVWPRHELLLIGVRSKTPHPRDRSESIFFASRRRHSEKPEEAYTIIERMYAGPYLEFFARAKREGWAAYGNEIEEENDGRDKARATADRRV